MSRETLCCVFQVFLFGTDPLFWVCEKAKIWSPCMVEPLLILVVLVDCMIHLCFPNLENASSYIGALACTDLGSYRILVRIASIIVRSSHNMSVVY